MCFQAAAHRCDEHRLNTLQRTLSILLGERQQLQAEHHCSVAARIKLETLCRELQAHQCVLRVRKEGPGMQVVVVKTKTQEQEDKKDQINKEMRSKDSLITEWTQKTQFVSIMFYF